MLVTLPITVTCIFVIVQKSLAVAFGLVAVIGAVQFRNRLRLSSEVVFVLVAIAIGLASGVRALGIAAVMSLFFNYIILLFRRYQPEQPAPPEKGDGG